MIARHAVMSGRVSSTLPFGPVPRTGLADPQFVLLVGGDSVVTRVLLIFLRKEGLDAAIVSDDPAAWANELMGRPNVRAAQAIVLSPGVTGARRAALCQRLRQDERLGGVPILSLRDAGDEPLVASAGAIGGPARTIADPADGADVTLTWPFRLREVHRTVDALLRRAKQASHVAAV